MMIQPFLRFCYMGEQACLHDTHKNSVEVHFLCVQQVFPAAVQSAKHGLSTRHSTSLLESIYLSSPAVQRTCVGVCVLGAAAGGMGSLVGLGGAFIIIPALTGPVGLSAHHAIGTSMAAVLATSLGASIAYTINCDCVDSDAHTTVSSFFRFPKIPQHMGAVDVTAALTIIAFSTVFAVVGARASRLLSERHVRRAQGVLMMAIAPSLIFSDGLKSMSNSLPPSSQNPHFLLKHAPLEQLQGIFPVSQQTKLACVGAVSGMAAGFFGIGGGAVTVPALMLLLNFDYRTALATSLAVMVPTALTGVATHFVQKTMILPLALPLSVGTAAGAYVGGRCSKSVDEARLKHLFAATMLTLGVRTFLKAAKR